MSLIPAQLMAAELGAAWRTACLADLERMRWYRLATGCDWTPGPWRDGDWHQIARASVRQGDAGPEVLGYCAASIDRDTNVCTGLEAWSVSTSIAYVRDLDAFMDLILEQVSWCRFRHAVGNPAGKGWARWAQRHGGHQLGVLHHWGRDHTGRLVDVALYQVPGRLGQG